jgi:hypothetical protein
MVAKTLLFVALLSAGTASPAAAIPTVNETLPCPGAAAAREKVTESIAAVSSAMQDQADGMDQQRKVVHTYQDILDTATAEVLPARNVVDDAFASLAEANKAMDAAQQEYGVALEAWAEILAGPCHEAPLKQPCKDEILDATDAKNRAAVHQADRRAEHAAAQNALAAANAALAAANASVKSAQDALAAAEDAELKFLNGLQETVANAVEEQEKASAAYQAVILACNGGEQCDAGYIGEHCASAFTISDPDPHNGCNGRYTRVTDQVCNGKPVYRRGHETYYLFQPSNTSTWCVASSASTCHYSCWLQATAPHEKVQPGMCAASPDGVGCEGKWRSGSTIHTWTKVVAS